MIVVVCLDDNNGMLFNNRRQSMDRMLIEDVLSLTKESRIWMNAYSSQQFISLGKENIQVDEEFLSNAGRDDYCFVEDHQITDYISSIDQIIIYRWNRKYPSDVTLDYNPGNQGWTLLETKDFVGTSHDKITREIYK
jgi:hypothetical protein